MEFNSEDQDIQLPRHQIRFDYLPDKPTNKPESVSKPELVKSSNRDQSHKEKNGHKNESLALTSASKKKIKKPYTKKREEKEKAFKKEEVDPTFLEFLDDLTEK